MGNKGDKMGSGGVTVAVKTANRPFAGTDNKVFIILRDSKGGATRPRLLDNPFQNDLERGRKDTFTFKEAGDLHDVTEIEIWRDGVVDDDWLAEYIVVTLSKGCSRSDHVFPIHRWVPNEPRHLVLREYDSYLPQFDPHAAQRRHLLEEERDVYSLSVTTPGLPPRCMGIPPDETFSEAYRADLFRLNWRVECVKARKKMLAGKWKTLEDIANLYFGESLPLPKAVQMKLTLEDLHFSNQRVAGCNPCHIRLCTDIPQHFAVNHEVLAPLLEGHTLPEVLKKSRMFLVDYSWLDDLEQNDTSTKFPAPMALFYRDNRGDVIPVAIQLQLNKQPTDQHPVFLPCDPKYTWHLAKMWFNAVDACVHQAKLHLGFTHLIMEPICVVTHRQLSRSHPVFRLLAPHFLFLIAVNGNGVGKLLEPKGWIDNMLLCGRKGAHDIIRRTLTRWRLDIDGTLPEELRSRQVSDPKVLPHYPYRDDAILLYDAILKYVTTIVRFHYDSNETIQNDSEIQAWVAELVTSAASGGAGIQGVPGRGRLEDADELISIVTPIIFTCSAQHAAVNFNQYEEYAFPMNYPAFLNGDPPNDKEPRTPADLLGALPDKRMTLDTAMVCRILSERALIPKRLAHFEVQYAYDPIALQALSGLRSDLVTTEDTIRERNRSRPEAYTVLLPSAIPNSISI